jgi:uncharacterized protein YbjT (DUF2867 family)
MSSSVENRKLTVLVTGATGQQGGVVAKYLLEHGHNVRALSRNADSEKSRALKEQGAEIATGNFDDLDSIVEAARGVDTVFAMGSPFEEGIDGETKQAITIANAAVMADASHLVYSSVAGADENTGIPHFESKYKVEEHIKGLGIPYTIIAPVFFMENLMSPFLTLEGLKQGKLGMAMPASRKLQHIALENIGEAVAYAIENRNSFQNKRINIASDDLTGIQAAEILTNVTGKVIEYEVLPLEQLYANSEDMGRMYEWFDEVGYSTDLDQLRNDFPDVNWKSFKDWAMMQDWSVLD